MRLSFVRDIIVFVVMRAVAAFLAAVCYTRLFTVGDRAFPVSGSFVTVCHSLFSHRECNVMSQFNIRLLSGYRVQTARSHCVDGMSAVNL